MIRGKRGERDRRRAVCRVLKCHGCVNETTIKERPATLLVSDLAVLGSHVDGTRCKSHEVDPRQCGALTAQFLGYNAAAGLRNCPETLIREFSEERGFTAS